MNNANDSVLSGYLTSNEASRLLGVTLRWFYELVKNKKIPGPVNNIGRTLLWEADAIKAYKHIRREKRK